MSLTNTVEAMQIAIQAADKDIDRIFSLLGWQQAAVISILGFVSYISYRASKREIENLVSSRVMEIEKQIKAEIKTEYQKLSDGFEDRFAHVESMLHTTHANSVVDTHRHWAFLSKLRGIRVLLRAKDRSKKITDTVNVTATTGKVLLEQDLQIKKRLFDEDPANCQEAESILAEMVQDENHSVIGKVLQSMWGEQKFK